MFDRHFEYTGEITKKIRKVEGHVQFPQMDGLVREEKATELCLAKTQISSKALESVMAASINEPYKTEIYIMEWNFLLNPIRPT